MADTFIDTLSDTLSDTWGDSARRKKIIGVTAAVFHVVLLALTRRDLSRRPDEAVRGPKRLWQRWALLNTTGSIAYWIVGRRRMRGLKGETALTE